MTGARALLVGLLAAASTEARVGSSAEGANTDEAIRNLGEWGSYAMGMPKHHDAHARNYYDKPSWGYDGGYGGGLAWNKPYYEPQETDVLEKYVDVFFDSPKCLRYHDKCEKNSDCCGYNICGSKKNEKKYEYTEYDFSEYDKKYAKGKYDGHKRRLEEEGEYEEEAEPVEAAVEEVYEVDEKEEEYEVKDKKDDDYKEEKYCVAPDCMVGTSFGCHDESEHSVQICVDDEDKYYAKDHGDKYDDKYMGRRLDGYGNGHYGNDYYGNAPYGGKHYGGKKYDNKYDYAGTSTQQHGTKFDVEGTPTCKCQFGGDYPWSCYECASTSDCNVDEICKDKKCVDPCDSHKCGSGQECKIRNGGLKHEPEPYCKCKYGLAPGVSDEGEPICVVNVCEVPQVGRRRTSAINSATDCECQLSRGKHAELHELVQAFVDSIGIDKVGICKCKGQDRFGGSLTDVGLLSCDDLH